MQNKLKVFVEARSYSDTALYRNMGHEVVSNIDEADIIHLVGGADISPFLYTDREHPHTHHQPFVDERSLSLIEQAKGRPIVGICRGGQLLNALAGGSMYQHVVGHANGGRHLITDLRNNKVISVNSLHHQMMIPADHAEVIAVAHGVATLKQKDSSTDNINEPIDTEVVWYPDTKWLCFQPHPEYVDINDVCAKYFVELFNEFIIPVA